MMNNEVKAMATINTVNAMKLNEVTRAVALEVAIDAISTFGDNLDEEIKETILTKLTKLRASVSRSNSSSSSAPTKTQKENAGLRETILGLMEGGRGYRAGEMAKILSDETGSEISLNKASALLNQLVKLNKVLRTSDEKNKKVVLFVLNNEVA